ncbi:uncharacterized protein LOC106174632 [Lingula anatina]|uniref:Uncharacterized protein LOC106174632 n=1 Tax=Lingula anatina TaxID=7574 RepID=A0A1S3JNM2_LINAN|nr:uncharacterized protein LOC106174632 [Lingula anatina]|eukprot:XP_013411741.1 uncharacterized protein LOC106174632 [Lingula anatina]
MKAISTIRTVFHQTIHANRRPLSLTTTVKRWMGGQLPGQHSQELAARTTMAYSPFETLNKYESHVDLFSCDYLGLGQNEELNWVHAYSILRHGMDRICSCVVSHPGDSPVRDTERALARWLKSESAALTYSCTAANIGAMEILLKGNQRPVYVDRFAHATLQVGVTFAGAAGRLHVFQHNDLDHLRSLIAKTGSGVVVVDSIYSTNGEEAPMADLVDLCHDLGCILVVDESHALGVIGEQGEGLVAHLGLEDGVHVRTTSLHKSLTCDNGVIASSRDVTDCFNHATTLGIFSNAMQISGAMRVKKAMELAMQATEQRENLRKMSKSFRQQLKEAGFPVRTDIDHPIVSVVVGQSARAVEIHHYLCSKGIYPWVFFYPATPKDGAMVRFVINQYLTPEKLAYTVETIKNFRDDLKPPTGMGREERSVISQAII